MEGHAGNQKCFPKASEPRDTLERHFHFTRKIGCAFVKWIFSSQRCHVQPPNASEHLLGITGRHLWSHLGHPWDPSVIFIASSLHMQNPWISSCNFLLFYPLYFFSYLTAVWFLCIYSDLCQQFCGYKSKQMWRACPGQNGSQDIDEDGSPPSQTCSIRTTPATKDHIAAKILLSLPLYTPSQLASPLGWRIGWDGHCIISPANKHT